jgi:purine-binding chemotaxis protein CheW
MSGEAPEQAQRPVGVLVFRLSDQRLGLFESDVVEIAAAVSLVPLPEAPPLIEGLVNVRGAIVPVLDLRLRLKLPPKPIALTDHLIFTRASGRLVALRADRAESLMSVDRASIDASLTPSAGLVAGVATLPDGLLLISDPARFLSDDEALELDRAMTGSER